MRTECDPWAATGKSLLPQAEHLAYWVVTKVVGAMAAHARMRSQLRKQEGDVQHQTFRHNNRQLFSRAKECFNVPVAEHAVVTAAATAHKRDGAELSARKEQRSS